MDTDEFWRIIETARSSATPTDEALVELLSARPIEEIFEFQKYFDEAHDAVYRWDMWAAAYLIQGGCSDDSFIDFRAGLIALGRDWYEKAARCPDSLADHPAVRATAPNPCYELFYEEINYAATEAFDRRTADRDAFDAGLVLREAASAQEAEQDMGEDFDFDDPGEMRQRLPRLASLYLGNGAL
ncbi:DUF4240 domain-containing protein [Streptomyces sp. NPDC050743]|uniref:DUF4240 domain-containing protein n=1 Tax=Streptomyces sp. NPDC050743 TaxID=3365634 RepID=UPI0037B32DA5